MSSGGRGRAIQAPGRLHLAGALPVRNVSASVVFRPLHPNAITPMQLRLRVPAVACLAIAAIAPSTAAQGTPEAVRRFAPFVSGGASVASRLPDGSGVHLELGLIRPLANGVSVRLEAARHVYGAVALAPCLIQDAAHCYQTMDRRVTAGIVSAVVSRPYRRGSLYLIGGAGVYGSRRVATRYPSCELGGACDNATYTLEMRATQPGVNGGIGAQVPLGTVSAFADLRVHYMVRTSPSGGPSNDYFLLPLTVGLRL